MITTTESSLVNGVRIAVNEFFETNFGERPRLLRAEQIHNAVRIRGYRPVLPSEMMVSSSLTMVQTLEEYHAEVFRAGRDLLEHQVFRLTQRVVDSIEYHAFPGDHKMELIVTFKLQTEGERG